MVHRPKTLIDRHRSDSLRPILHHHIPKTAGTAVKEMLSKTFEPMEVMPAGWFKHGDSKALRHGSCFERFRFVSAHANLIGDVPGEWVAFTLVRNPIARVASLCDDWARLTDADLEHLEGDNKKTKIMARALSVSDMVTLDTKLASQNLRNGMVKSLLGRSSVKTADIDLSPEWAAREALTRCMKSLTFIGEVERFNESMSALKKLTNRPLPKPIVRNQTRIGPRQFTESDRAVLAEVNQADLIFYGLVKEQLSLHGGDLKSWRISSS